MKNHFEQKSNPLFLGIRSFSDAKMTVEQDRILRDVLMDT